MTFVVVVVLAVAALVAADSDRVGTMELVRSVNKQTKLWTASLSSPVAHLSHKEVRGILGAGPEGFEPPSKYMKLVSHSAEDYVNAPESYDPRDHYPNCSSMRMIRDQSACGSCWSFGSVEAMSDRTCIAEKADVVLSANDLLACSNGGSCDGGRPHRAFEYWLYNGTVTEECQPYPFPSCDHHIPGSKNPCPDEDYPTPECQVKCKNGKKWEDEKHFASAIYYVNGEKDMVAELSMKGPVEASLAIYEDFMVYTSGVYHHVSGKLLGYHSIKVLGYGVDDGTKYWLVANSWNEHWGEKGFFRILRGNDECEIETYAITGTPRVD